MGDATHHQSLSLITIHAAMTVNRSQWRLTGCAKQNIPGPTATCRRNRQRTRGFSEACETSWRTAYGQLRSSEKRWPAESTVHTCLNGKLPSLGFAFANHNFLLLVPTLSSLCTVVHAACSADLPSRCFRPVCRNCSLPTPSQLLPCTTAW